MRDRSADGRKEVEYFGTPMSFDSEEISGKAMSS